MLSLPDLASDSDRHPTDEAGRATLDAGYRSEGSSRSIVRSTASTRADLLLRCHLQSLERILYVWAIRHPASGYVQGINDLVIPFFQIFLSAYIGTSTILLPWSALPAVWFPIGTDIEVFTSRSDADPETFDLACLPSHALDAVEADSFWCLSKLLDGIQDNYIFAQPGIQRSVKKMAELVGRIDRESSPSLSSPRPDQALRSLDLFC